MKNQTYRKARATLGFLALVAFVYVGVQILVAYQYAVLSVQTEQQFENIETESIEERKKLEEAIALKIENNRKKFFWATFISNISATIGILAAFAGIWMGFRQYLQAQEKHQHEQARERRDRIATDLSDLWRSVASEKPAERAGCVARLQDLLSEDKVEFHKRAVSTLALMARMHRQDEALQDTLVPVVEECVRKLPSEVVTSVSWQRTRLYRTNFSGAVLTGMDFRDAFLEEADFSRADLRRARFDAARLNGANFDYAVLDGAVLKHADLAGASFCNASLVGADIGDVMLLDADFSQADLRGTEKSWADLDITQAKNWRSAGIESKMRQDLIESYGMGPQKPRVLMIMWEMEPVVSGGGWTAVYHLVKQLSRHGADLTLIIPWMDSPISRSIFGNEVKLVAVGIDAQEPIATQYAGCPAERYGGGSPIYAGLDYASGYGSGRYTTSKTLSATDLVNRFTEKALAWLQAERPRFDVIHAHDWLSFPAAGLMAERLKIPWVAHFHSIEADRRKIPTDWIARIEAQACRNANTVVAVSRVTRDRLVSIYGASVEDVVVVPNCLSDQPATWERINNPDPGWVVFVGRRCWQKGSDLFIHIARAVQRMRPQTRFAMFGKDASGEGFLYDHGAGRSGRLASTPELVHATHIRQPDLYLEPFGQDEMSQGVQMISQIRAIEYQPPGMISQIDFPEGMDEQSAKWLLLSMGAALFEQGPQSGFTHMAVLQDHGRGRPPVWGFLVYAPALRQLPGKHFEEPISVHPFTPWPARKSVFSNASILVAPSRHEPFGMQVLEAMQQGVPVMVSQNAGVCEVAKSVICIDPLDVSQTAEKIVGLLADADAWQKQVRVQRAEIAGYADRGYEKIMMDVWLEPGSKVGDAGLP